MHGLSAARLECAGAVVSVFGLYGMFAAWVCLLYLGVLYRGFVLDDVAYVVSGLRFSSLSYRRCILLLCMFIGLLVSGFYAGCFDFLVFWCWVGLGLGGFAGCGV